MLSLVLNKIAKSGIRMMRLNKLPIAIGMDGFSLPVIMLEFWFKLHDNFAPITASPEARAAK